jgi:predicted acetyltransferase
MQFRRATDKDRKAIESLWAYCFEKPDEPFFRWYFSRLCRPEDVVVADQDGQIAADLHLRPYDICLRGEPIPVDYIVGVSTHPAARGSGIARALLKNSFRISRDSGKAAVILMPSEASFYRPLGFSYYVHQWQRRATPEHMAQIATRAEKAMTLSSPDQWEILSEIYDVFTSTRNGYAMRGEDSWRRHIEGQLEEGYIAVVYDNEGPAGYLFYGIEDRTLKAGEMVYRSDRGRRGLYAYMAGHRGSVDWCKWYEPVDDRSFLYWPGGAEHIYINNRTFPYMLCRITDPVGAFDGVPCRKGVEGFFSFQLVDPILSENNGVYMIEADHGMIHALQEDVFYKLRLHIEDVSGVELGNHIPEPSFCININAAGEWLFGSSSFVELESRDMITWLIDGEEERGKIRELAEKMLPRERNWISEWY